MTETSLDRRLTTVETTATGLAVQGAEIQAAVKVHTTVVQRAADTVGDLAESLDNSGLFELLPKVAAAAGDTLVAAGDAKRFAEQASAGVKLIVEDTSTHAELFAKFGTALDKLGTKTTETGAQAKATLERVGALDGTVAAAAEGLGALAAAQKSTQDGIGAERTARERWQAATGKRLDALGVDLAGAKGAAELAKAAAERTAAAAEAQAEDVASIRATVESVLAAVTAIARGETKAAVLATDDKPTAAGS